MLGSFFNLPLKKLLLDMTPTLLVVTGAASGIGLQLARYFHTIQIPMILIDLDELKLRDLFSPERNHLIGGDVSKELTWQKVLEMQKKSACPFLT